MALAVRDLQVATAKRHACWVPARGVYLWSDACIVLARNL